MPSNIRARCYGLRCRKFQSVERICVPSNCLAFQARRLVVHGFNPSNGFVCLRTAHRLALREGIVRFQSVERICVPSNGFHTIADVPYRSMFQSVERICVPSNLNASAIRRFWQRVSIRRTDLCAFERWAPDPASYDWIMFQSVERGMR